MTTIKKIITLIILVLILIFALQIRQDSSVIESVEQQAVGVVDTYFSDLIATPLTDRSVLLSWKSEMPTQFTLKYATSTEASTKMFVKDELFSSSHTIELNHLEPITRYYFIIDARTEGNETAGIEGQFSTK